MKKKDRPSKGTSAVIYTRVSDPKQTTNTSLSTQERTCREFCDRQGYKIAGIYPEDTGRTGRNANRPSFQEALSTCIKSKHIGHFVVFRFNRYFRNVTAHHVNYDELLEKYGVRVESATEDCNTDSPIDKRMRAELAAAAEFESDDIGEKARMGMREARLQGRLTNQPPMGLLREWVAKDYTIVVHDPVLAPHIERMFMKYDDGKLPEEIVAELNAEGFRTSSGRKLTLKQLGRILRNMRYAGWVPVDEVTEPVKAAFKGIVSKDLFDRVQARLERKLVKPQSAYKRDREEFPLRRFIRCKTCGKPYTASISTGKSGKRYPYYHCRTKGCKGRSIPADDLHRIFQDVIAMYKINPNLLTALHGFLEEGSSSEIERSRKVRSTLLNQIQSLFERRQKLVDLRIEDEISRSLFEEQIAINKEMSESAERELKSCPQPETLMQDLDVYLSLFMDLSQLWEHAPLELRQALQRAMFKDSMKWDPGRSMVLIGEHSRGLTRIM